MGRNTTDVTQRAHKGTQKATKRTDGSLSWRSHERIEFWRLWLCDLCLSLCSLCPSFLSVRCLTLDARKSIAPLQVSRHPPRVYRSDNVLRGQVVARVQPGSAGSLECH